MRFKVIFILVILITVGSYLLTCNKEQTLKYGTKSPVIRNLVQGKSIQEINLDQQTIDTVVLGAKNKISGMTLANPSGLLALNNSTYITDVKQQNVIVADSSGQFTGEIGRKGSGPGEFRKIEYIFNNSNNVFVADANNARINVYDSSFNFKTEFNTYIGSGDAAASNKNIFLPTEIGKKNLVKVFDTSPIYKEDTTFFPRLIPRGKEPSAYNNFEITANSNTIFVTYPGLPLVFIYDKNINHVLTLQFVSQIFDGFQNPPPVANSSNKKQKVRRFVYDINSTDDQLFLIINNSLTILSSTKEGYKLDNRFKFYKENGEQIFCEFISYNEGTFFLASGFDPVVYKFTYNKP